jgi:hypothetical protein
MGAVILASLSVEFKVASRTFAAELYEGLGAGPYFPFVVQLTS